MHPVTCSVPGSDGGVPDLREVLSEQAAFREPVETVFRLPVLSGVFGGAPRERAAFPAAALTHRDGDGPNGRALGLQECQRKLDHKLSLDSYLLKPVQRITKYQLLLKVSCLPPRGLAAPHLQLPRPPRSAMVPAPLRGPWLFTDLCGAPTVRRPLLAGRGHRGEQLGRPAPRSMCSRRLHAHTPGRAPTRGPPCKAACVQLPFQARVSEPVDPQMPLAVTGLGMSGSKGKNNRSRSGKT